MSNMQSKPCYVDPEFILIIDVMFLIDHVRKDVLISSAKCVESFLTESSFKLSALRGVKSVPPDPKSK